MGLAVDVAGQGLAVVLQVGVWQQGLPEGWQLGLPEGWQLGAWGASGSCGQVWGGVLTIGGWSLGLVGVVLHWGLQFWGVDRQVEG